MKSRVQPKNLVMSVLIVSVVTGFVFSLELARSIKGTNNAAATVQSYLEAMVDKDRAATMYYTCPAFEMQAGTEFASFGAVTATLNNVACREVGESPDGKRVSCDGQIVFNYTGETRTLDLSRRTYIVTADGICGYE